MVPGRDAFTFRALLIQGAVIAAIIALFVFIGSNFVANAERLNIHTGFAFLNRRAGFDMTLKLVPFTEDSTYLDTLWVALTNTILVALLSCIGASVLGLFVGLGRLSTNKVIAGVATAYVETVRNIPLLLQLFYWYFGVLAVLPNPRQSLSLFHLIFLNKRGLVMPAPVGEPGLRWFLAALVAGIVVWSLCSRVAKRRRVETGQESPLRHVGPATLLVLVVAAIAATGWPIAWDVPKLGGFNFQGGMVIIPELVAMTWALSLYGAAFIGELVRGSIKSVPPGQMEAGLSLGLPKWRVYAFIVLPQALRALVPPLGNQYIVILKNSSLGTAIAYPDLMLVWSGTVLNSTGQPLEVMFLLMLCYLCMCLLIALGANALNKRIQLVER